MGLEGLELVLLPEECLPRFVCVLPSFGQTSSTYTRCPDQAAFDPYNSDAGNGQFPNGSWVTPSPQTNVYEPWNTTLAAQWLSGLTHKPDIVTGQRSAFKLHAPLREYD